MSKVQDPMAAGNRTAARRGRRVSIFGAGTPSCRNGFPLVEVLASMAVLVVLILALTRMFVMATNITRSGTSSLMRNSTGDTAMETLLPDAEGMVVNERLACYVRADTTDSGSDGFGFDDVWFISTSGDQDDDMPYEYFHYYVTNSLSTTPQGAPYLRFDLVKDRMIFAVGDSRGMYALSTNDTQWWEIAQTFAVTAFGPWDRQVLADHVVRFDIYCTGWDGEGWMGGYSGVHEFDSTRGPDDGAPNVPPAAFDIYLQLTSPDVAMEAGMALVAGVPTATQKKAREMMIRDSSSLFGRASPIIGPARYHSVVNHGTNNTAYYAE